MYFVNIDVTVSVPEAGFTQRATIDPELNEIHVLSVRIFVYYFNNIQYYVQFTMFGGTLKHPMCQLSLHSVIFRSPGFK